MTADRLEDLTADALIEDIARIRAGLAQHGVLAERLAVHPDDWLGIEQKLKDFCEERGATSVSLQPIVPQLLGLSVFISDRIPKGTLNIGPWFNGEKERCCVKKETDDD